MIDFPEKYKEAKAVLYARVSSEEQVKGFSTEAQTELLENMHSTQREEYKS